MNRCKNCRKQIVESASIWIHEESGDSFCDNKTDYAEPLKFCTSCNEPQTTEKEICGCGYRYEVKR